MLNLLKDSKGKLIRPNPLFDKLEFMTDPVFIVGNGNSRENFDLKKLRGKGTIIGCNALYRDFSPDILVAVNYRMIKEAQNYAKENCCITLANRERDLKHFIAWKVPEVNSSGCLAIKIVSLLIRPSKCYMLGMDCYKGNIYNDTKNYPKDKRRNLEKMFKHNVQAVEAAKETIFINVNIKDNWPENTTEFITYKTFENEILYRK